MPQRRVDTTLGVTYDTPPDKIQAVLADLRALLRAHPGVHQGQIVVSLADFNDSSLRVQILYFTADPDWDSHMAVREQVNLAILNTFAARGVALAFPSSVIHLDGPVARQLAAGAGAGGPAA
jgi:MscS family membrane protein